MGLDPLQCLSPWAIGNNDAVGGSSMDVGHIPERDADGVVSGFIVLGSTPRPRILGVDFASRTPGRAFWIFNRARGNILGRISWEEIMYKHKASYLEDEIAHLQESLFRISGQVPEHWL
jgi:hypothetical protein